MDQTAGLGCGSGGDAELRGGRRLGGGCLAEAGNVARDLAAVQDLGGWERFGLKILPWFLRKGTQVPPSKKKNIYIYRFAKGLTDFFLEQDLAAGQDGCLHRCRIKLGSGF